MASVPCRQSSWDPAFETEEPRWFAHLCTLFRDAGHKTFLKTNMKQHYVCRIVSILFFYFKMSLLEGCIYTIQLILRKWGGPSVGNMKLFQWPRCTELVSNYLLCYRHMISKLLKNIFILLASIYLFKYSNDWQVQCQNKIWVSTFQLHFFFISYNYKNPESYTSKITLKIATYSILKQSVLFRISFSCRR